jgi:heat-inducible transcriptional repressor
LLSESLTKRERLVLEALVRAYVDLRTPVGSRTIVRREGFEFSPATMRKTLSSLERKGFVRQPHTSAGRLPTDEGYRFFVDEGQTQKLDLTAEEFESLRSNLEEVFQQVRADEIHGQLAAILGDVSNQLGLALAPRFEQAVFQGLELVRLTSQQLLLVASLAHGPVQSLVIEVDSEVSQADMNAVRQLLNERLAGLTMSEIKSTARERLGGMRTQHPQLLRVVLDEIESLLAPPGHGLFVAGARHIFEQPEFSDSSEVAGLVDLLERKEVLADLLAGREGVVVTIGEENEPMEMRQCSVVTASYTTQDAVGVLGIIGPTRMPYKRLVALLNYTASRTADFVG